MLYTLSLCVVRLIICHCCLLVLLSIVCIVVLSVTWTTCFFSVAEADPWDQGLPPHREEEGCPVCEDQEEQRCRQVQGPLLQVLVHPLRLRRWEGKQVEAVSPTRLDCGANSVWHHIFMFTDHAGLILTWSVFSCCCRGWSCLLSAKWNSFFYTCIHRIDIHF